MIKRKSTKLALGEVMKPAKKRPRKVKKCVAIGNGAVKLIIEPGSYSELELYSSRGFSLWADTERYASDTNTEWVKSYRSDRDEKVQDAKILISLLNEFINSVEEKA